jgi:hypothetical protein
MPFVNMKNNLSLHSSKKKEERYESKSLKAQHKYACWMVEKHRSQKQSMFAAEYMSFFYCGSMAVFAVGTVATFGIAGPIIFGSASVASAGCNIVSRKYRSKKREQQYLWRIEKENLSKKLRKIKESGSTEFS